MEVNGKDLAYVYILGFAVFILFTFGTAGLTMATSFNLNGISVMSYIFFIGIYGIPLGFYFWRNRPKLKEAAVISLGFGTTLVPSILFLMFVISYVLISIAGSGKAYLDSILFADINWGALIAEFIVNGILVLIMAVPLWFLVKEIRGEKEFEDIKPGLTEEYKNFLNSFGKDKNK